MTSAPAPSEGLLPDIDDERYPVRVRIIAGLMRGGVHVEAANRIVERFEAAPAPSGHEHYKGWCNACMNEGGRLAAPSEGLDAAARAVADHHSGEPGHHMNDSCWRTLYARLSESAPEGGKDAAWEEFYSSPDVRGEG